MVCEKDIFNFNVSKINNLIETIKLILAINNSEDNKDIIYQIFDSHSHIKTYSENIFNMHILNTLAKFENSNLVLYENLAEIYLKYVCIKSEFYKEVTQSDTIKGLDFFRLYFSRAVYGFKKDHFYYTTMFRTLFQNKYLKKVELRFSLNRNIDEDRKQIKDILTAYHDVLKEDFDLHSEEVSFPRIGIVYHLIKMPDSIEKCITSERHGDKYYFGSAQEKYLNQVNQMLELRNKIPHLSRFIVGIDAASAENNTPVQVFAPVFNIARDSHGEKLLKVDKKAKIIRKQSLFFTFHAGEDFRHLLSGLRRIDEVIDFCKLHSGDRIGHAIALGISVDTWVKENPIVAIPRGEYLDNLIWVWGVYSNLSNIRSKAFIFLEQRILKLVKEVYSFSENVAIQTLYSAYLKRFEKVSHFDCDIICEEGKCSIKNINNVINSDIIKASYNCKICLEKIKEPIYINPCDLEYEIIKEMQDYLQEKVARKGIVIEINPTSNAAIGSMKSIFDNQLYSLNYIGDDAKKNIMICINSDNPLVFNTNVSNEIGYLYYGMLKKGVGRESALLWIEKLRKTGMDTSFIKLNTSNKEYLYALETVIEELDNSAHI